MKEPLREAIAGLLDTYFKDRYEGYDNSTWDSTNKILNEIQAAMPKEVPDNIGSSSNKLHWGKLLGYNLAIRQQQAVFKQYKEEQ